MDEKKCEGLAEIISAYRDGETTAEERALVETHLRVCSACAQRLAYYEDLHGTLRRYLAAAPASSPAQVGSTRPGASVPTNAGEGHALAAPPSAWRPLTPSPPSADGGEGKGEGVPGAFTLPHPVPPPGRGPKDRGLPPASGKERDHAPACAVHTGLPVQLVGVDTRTGGSVTKVMVGTRNTERARFKPLGAWTALAAVVVLSIVAAVYFGGRPATVQAQEVVEKAARVAADPVAGGIDSLEIERTGWVRIVDGRFGEAGSEVRNQERILWQAPNLWRIESQGMFGNSRLEINDGKDLWQVAEGQLTTVQPWDPQIDVRSRLLAFSGANLADVLASAQACYNPRLTGEDVVAGRSAHVIDLGVTECPAASGGGIGNGRRVIWIDKETFFVLKSEQYMPDEVDGLFAADETTKVVYNGRIDPALLSYDVPAGVAFEDLRPGPAPTDEQYGNQLASLAAKADYALFVPAEVPNGMKPRQPRLSPSVGVELAYVPVPEVEHASLAQEHGIWISQQRATDALIEGWTAGMEPVTVAGHRGWLRHGGRNADGTATDSAIIVVRDGTLVSIASFAFSAEELLMVAASLEPVSAK